VVGIELLVERRELHVERREFDIEKIVEQDREYRGRT
jgi:hypothetical protein